MVWSIFSIVCSGLGVKRSAKKREEEKSQTNLVWQQSSDEPKLRLIKAKMAVVVGGGRVSLLHWHRVEEMYGTRRKNEY